MDVQFEQEIVVTAVKNKATHHKEKPCIRDYLLFGSVETS